MTAVLICAFPLAGFITLAAFGRRIGEPLAGWVATGALGMSFLMASVTFLNFLYGDVADRREVVTLFSWVPVGDFSVDAALLVDPLSVTMALFITGVGSLIHIYAIGYMHGDSDFSRFFIYLNLFAFSMLVLVLGDNLLMTFLGWEGVGVCSYLLISFWFSDEANATAGKKAFITNRVGDWGFMLAMFVAFSAIGSIRYLDLFGHASSLSTTTATAITLLLFLGAAGKSAQLPLYIWLPDAMAGPTPVSALIHAATMVTAGVYLLVRVNPVIAMADPLAPQVIAWVGVLTALFAATIAVAQNDIKKALAYSTISQLGYMMLAVGTGAYVAAIFHMVTHAFFKALLFLGSGSVIHALGGDQDMRRYGGLRALMPVTSGTFIVGWLAIAGVPPFSGFWSKDEILVYAWDSSRLLWGLGLVTAILTAYYMSRQVFMTFYGTARYEINSSHSSDHGAGDHGDGQLHESPVHESPAHESPALMIAPLVVLAGAAIFAGALNLPFTKGLHYLGRWLEPSLFGNEAHLVSSAGTKWLLAGLAIAGATIGIGTAAWVYLRSKSEKLRGEIGVLANGWYVDDFVTEFVGGPGRKAFDYVAAFDHHVVDGAVVGAGKVVRFVGQRLRVIQTGFVRFYAALVALGALVLLIWFVLRATA